MDFMWRQMTMFVLIFFTFDHVSGRQENTGTGWRLVWKGENI